MVNNEAIKLAIDDLESQKKPNYSILRNIVQEMTFDEVGVNWVNFFGEQHNNKIKCVYLKALDKNRQVADNYQCFKHFYALGI
ncbi:hypothetical protein RJ035_007746 [Blastomyces gilchristii]